MKFRLEVRVESVPWRGEQQPWEPVLLNPLLPAVARRPPPRPSVAVEEEDGVLQQEATGQKEAGRTERNAGNAVAVGGIMME